MTPPPFLFTCFCIQYVASMMDPFMNGLQRRLWRNLRNREGNDQEPGAEHNRYRYQVYRTFVLWQHGRLGFGNRVVVPSCVVCRTRDEYPDPNNHYKGFEAADLCKYPTSNLKNLLSELFQSFDDPNKPVIENM